MTFGLNCCHYELNSFLVFSDIYHDIISYMILTYKIKVKRIISKNPKLDLLFTESEFRVKHVYYAIYIRMF